MKNPYGIPEEQLAEIHRRDQNCVYCHVEMPDPKDRSNNYHFATIEHVYPPGNDPSWVSFCCNACNMRHRIPLIEWFMTDYCRERCINEHTVAEPVKRFLASGLKEYDQIWLSGVEHTFLISVPWVAADVVPKRPHEHVERARLSPRDQKHFDRLLKAIAQRRYDFTFRGLSEGFGKYYGYMYWPCDGVLYRELLEP